MFPALLRGRRLPPELVLMALVIRNMKVEDLVDVKGVDLLCWNDLMQRSYGTRTKLSPRTDECLLSFLNSDIKGAFVASEMRAGVVGSVFSHVWGATGWVGPLSVLPSYQSQGLGKELLKHSLRYLEDQQCVDIGLETMPENATNLGMYLKVGLRTEGLVMIFAKKLDMGELEDEPSGSVSVERFSDSSVPGRMKSEIRSISNSLRLGLDYSKEVELTQKYSFGDTIIASSEGEVAGFSIVHTVPRRTNEPAAGIRVLAINPKSKAEVLEPLLISSELLAADADISEISIAVPSACRRATDSLFSRGYVIQRTLERLMWMGSSGMSDRTLNLCSWSG